MICPQITKETNYKSLAEPLPMTPGRKRASAPMCNSTECPTPSMSREACGSFLSRKEKKVEYCIECGEEIEFTKAARRVAAWLWGSYCMNPDEEVFFGYGTGLLNKEEFAKKIENLLIEGKP